MSPTPAHMLFYETSKPKRALAILLVGIVFCASFLAFTRAARADITSNLLAWWEFNAGSGTIAVDSSGNANTGTLNGGAGWAAGKIGSFALSLPGTAGNGVSFTQLQTGSAVTYAAWVYITDYRSGSFENVITQGPGSGIWMVGGKIDYYFGGDHMSAGTVPLNTWTHIAVIDDGGSVSFYINGAVDANTYSGVSVSSSNSIGCDLGTGGECLSGNLDDVRVYNRALAGSDISALYALGSAPAAPAISAIASSTTSTTATITWTTDTAASSTVTYGSTSGYGTASTTDALVTSHSIIISGLSPSTTYHFQVGSGNSNGVSTSSDLTFMTPAPPDTTPPVISTIASSTSAFTATVTWTTNENSTSKVAYGTSAGTYTVSTSSPSLVSSHSLGLIGLSDATMYFFVVVSSDASGNISTSSEKVLLTATSADVTPPIISAAASSTDSTTATITWTTDELASSTVRYGATSSYGSASSSVSYVTSHSITLTGLAPATLYHFRIDSADQSDNLATSSDRTFTTASDSITLCGGGPCVTIHNDDVIAFVGDSITSIDLYSAYFESYFDLMYPNIHVHFRETARSGTAVPNFTTGGLYDELIVPLHPNKVIVLMTGNGGYDADQYKDQVNDLDANYIVGESAATPMLLDSIPDNTPTGDTTVAGYAGALSTIGLANGYVFTDVWQYLHPIWADNLASTSPVDIQDGGDTGHMGPPAHLSVAYAYLNQLSAESDVSSTTIDAANARLVSEDHAAVSNIATTSQGIDFTRLDSRLPMAYDDRSLPIFEIMPQIYDQSKYMLTVTGLSAGDYYVYVDGVPSGSVSSTQLASGWNMSTMTSGPIHDQLQEVLGRLRDKEGLDRVTRAALSPNSGQVDYVSNAATCYETDGFRNDALRTCLATPIQKMNDLDDLIYAAAAPVSRNFSLRKAAGTPDTIPPAVSNPLPSSPLPQGTTSTTLGVTTDENAICRYDTIAQTPYISMAHTFAATGGTTHTQTLSGLLDGVTYTYYIRCQDQFGNRDMHDYTAAFSVNAEPNPIAHWAFDEGSGTTAADSSGNGHAATLVNGPSWISGKVGAHALSFDGTDDFVDAGDISDADNIGALTVSAWVKGPGAFAAQNYDVVTKFASGQGPWTLQYSGNSHAYACVVVNSSGTFASALGPTVAADDTDWHLVDCIYDGTKVTVYTDGVAGSAPNTPALTGAVKDRTDPVCIGGHSDGSDSCTTADAWQGSIDDVEIWKRALSPSEVMDMFTPDVTPPVISSIASSTAAATGTVTWTTDEAATSKVSYGASSGAYTTSTSSPSLVTSHTIGLTGLSALTTYFYVVVSADASGNISTSSERTLVTVNNSPAVTTSIASFATSTATLNGSITDTHGFDATQSGFAYGTSMDLASAVATTTLGAQVGTASFASSISGLAPGTLYYYRAYASSAQGIGYGTIQNFTTTAVAKPTVTTQAADTFTVTGATAHGNITATGNIDPTVRGFVYGTTAAYGATTTENGNFGTGAFTATLSGLTCNTLYHIDAYASSTQGIGYGSDTTFTAPCLSVLSSIASAPLTSTSQTISWTSDVAASSKIDFGIDNSYGSSTLEVDTSPRVLSHSIVLSPLLPCTVYHYRVRSKDAAATQAISPDAILETSGCTASAAVSTSTDTLITTGAGGTLDARNTSGTGLELVVPTSFSSTTIHASFQSKQLDSGTFFGTVALPSGLTLVSGYIFNLEALSDATTSLHSFDNPLTVSITYAAGDIANFDANTLAIKRYDGTSWNDLTNCSSDLTAKMVTCDTFGFSDFGLFGVYTSPPSNNGGGGGGSSSSSSSGGGGGGGYIPPIFQPVVPLNNPLCPIKFICTPIPGFVASATLAKPLGVSPASPLSLAKVFTRNLNPGQTGNDVKQLQIFLNLHGFIVAKVGAGSPGHETTLYGLATKAAVSAFQQAYADYILVPGGFKKPTGIFGPASRAMAIKLSQGLQ